MFNKSIVLLHPSKRSFLRLPVKRSLHHKSLNHTESTIGSSSTVFPFIATSQLKSLNSCKRGLSTANPSAITADDQAEANRHCKECVFLVPYQGDQVTNAAGQIFINRNAAINDIENCDQPRWFKDARNYFELFEISKPTFDISLTKLKSRYLELTFTAHPDRLKCRTAVQLTNDKSHPHKEVTTDECVQQLDRRQQLDCSEAITILTKAYNCLRDPFERALHLLSVQGHSVKYALEQQPSQEFLLEMMNLNEMAETNPDDALHKLINRRLNYVNQLKTFFQDCKQEELLSSGLLAEFRFIDRAIRNCQ